MFNSQEILSKIRAKDAEQANQFQFMKAPSAPTSTTNSGMQALLALNRKRQAAVPQNNPSINQNQTQKGLGFNTPQTSSTGSNYFDRLANVESKGNYTAHNKGSGAYGKYQFIPSTEKAYANKLGFTITQARTPEGQEAMIRRFTEDNKKGLAKSGYAPTDLNLWYAHNLGLGGAKSLLSGGTVNPRHISSNGANTQQGYINKWSKIFGGTQQRLFS